VICSCGITVGHTYANYAAGAAAAVSPASMESSDTQDHEDTLAEQALAGCVHRASSSRLDPNTAEDEPSNSDRENLEFSLGSGRY
jgi:hypothetical protein